jgi:TP901 family phage tail tape measure protein
MATVPLRLKFDPRKLITGAKTARTSLMGIAGGARKAETATETLARNGGRSLGAFGKRLGSVRNIALAAAAAIGAMAVSGFNSAKNLDAALGEASTLIAGTAGEMALMRAEANRMATTFGGSATDQVKGFYQAISAGANGVAGATEVLATANKLAVGGVTNIATAVDVLTTATNAYGIGALSSAKASNALFVGMKAGKTTITELSSTIGRAIPLGKALGVSFEEIVGTVSTLTTRGISTAEAVTGLRGVFAAIIKPTDEAAKAAALLGIEFSKAGIAAAGGFPEFLQEVIDKTGGSEVALAKLFTGVEGLTPVLALATGGMGKLSATMRAMRDDTTAADDAYEKVAGTLSKRLSTQLAIVGVWFQKMGVVLLTALVPALEGVVAAFQLLFKVVNTLLAPFSFLIGLVGDFVKRINPVKRSIEDTANATAEWTGAVDTHIQSEFDLEYALNQVTGENQKAAIAAVASANANLDAARVAYDRVDAELALAKALTARLIAENNVLKPKPGSRAGSSAAAVKKREGELTDALTLLGTLETELATRLTKVKDAVVGIDQAATISKDGPKSWDPFRRAVEKVESTVVGTTDAVKVLKGGLDEAQSAAKSMADVIGDGFGSMIDGTKTVQQAFRDMARDIISELYDVLVVQQLVGNIKSALGGDGGFLGGLFGSGGVVTTHAKGGVVNSPTLFPMNSGVGLMGEAGPEAIMPLSKTSSGDLGVKVAGGQSPTGGTVVINQSINVTTGVQSTVRSEIMNLMPQITEASKMGVLEARKRGGAFRGAF